LAQVIGPLVALAPGFAGGGNGVENGFTLWIDAFCLAVFVKLGQGGQPAGDGSSAQLALLEGGDVGLNVGGGGLPGQLADEVQEFAPGGIGKLRSGGAEAGAALADPGLVGFGPALQAAGGEGGLGEVEEMEEFEVLIYGGERVRETGDGGRGTSGVIYNLSLFVPVALP
jgi:hypothetical protein